MTDIEKEYPDESLVFEPVRVVTAPRKATEEFPTTPIRRPGAKVLEIYREWASLPARIRSEIPLAKHNVDRIQKALIEYRLVLLKYKFQAANVDSEIWDTYRRIFADVSELEKRTRRRGLRLSRLSHLRDLFQGWQAVIAQEADLLVTIDKAPASFDFYNKMMTFKEMHRVERLESEEISQKYSKAYQGLESALQYIEKFNTSNDMSIFGSSVLRVEDARAYWDERLNAIRDMEAENVDPDEVVQEINHLKDVMYEAPALAKWAHDVEQRFNRLVYDHELLVDTFSKAVIPDAELREHQTIMNEAIPRLWATGQREQLEQYIGTIERFIGIYDAQVASELSFAERHSLRRGGVEATTESQSGSFQQLVDLTRILVGAMEAREPAMINHSESVAKYSVEVSRQMNWPEVDIRYLELAALLHDVGKIGISESLLNKEGPLTPQDVAELKKHTLYGAQMMESFDSLKDIAPWIYYHQERWDGSGYPEGLAGEDIPIAARIIAVAETYAAMISGSAGKQPVTAEAALMEVQAQAGLAFDPNVVDVFVKIIRRGV
jgi:putative nucleotidyltransferase with HDIG domain